MTKVLRYITIYINVLYQFLLSNDRSRVELKVKHDSRPFEDFHDFIVIYKYFDRKPMAIKIVELGDLYKYRRSISSSVQRFTTGCSSNTQITANKDFRSSSTSTSLCPVKKHFGITFLIIKIVQFHDSQHPAKSISSSDKRAASYARKTTNFKS